MLRYLYYIKNFLYFKIRFLGRDIHVHHSSFISSKCIIKVIGGGSINIGAGCSIHQFAMILTYGGNITIGDNSSVNPFTIIYGHGGTSIGKGVRLAAHSTIIPANHIIGDENEPLYKKGVTAMGIKIEDYAWIGTGCRILDNVRIGRHGVIGAGSVVNKSIPDYSIAVGVPAKVIRTTAKI